MNDPNLIADLVRAGLDPDLVARVAAALAFVRDSPGHVRDIVRAYETGRKRKQRETPDKSSGKQTMSASVSVSEKEEVVRDKASDGSQLTSFLSSSEEERRTEKKKEEQASKRGTRLKADQQISEADLEFARSLGFQDAEILSIWVEFVDYWIGIPGQRGTKLSWSGTWRNRVRDMLTKRGKVNRHGKGSRLMDAIDGLIDRTGGEEVVPDDQIRDITPRGV